MDLEIAVYREDVDILTKALMTAVNERLGAMPYIDRSVIIAAALGNVACTVDAIETLYTAECTSRLRNVAESWAIGGTQDIPEFLPRRYDGGLSDGRKI